MNKKNIKKYFSAMLYIVGITMTFPSMTQELKTTKMDSNNIINKSKNDPREITKIKLDNGLKALLISDKDANRAAAAVDVMAGSSDEPDNFPGLAHFLEHMLFLGTDKYPEPDEYINFINSHGGSHNAFTTYSHTNYFFDIDPKYLHEGLKRFSRFFISPLLSDKYINQEKNAVDSEYNSKLKEDGWRNLEVFKESINQEHKFSRFTIGNNNTLTGDRLKEELVSFYKNNYTEDNIGLVIIGKESTEVLEKWVRNLFSEVPSTNTSNLKKERKEKLFNGLDLPILIENKNIQPTKDLSLYFTFPFDIEDEYKKTFTLISYIIGYEGKGSLLSALKKENLATSLYAGKNKIDSENNFEIGIELTDYGKNNIDKVIDLFFAYISIMKKSSDIEKEYIYNDLKKIADINFTFYEKVEAISEASHLANKLNKYPSNDVMSIAYDYPKYPKESIDRVIKGFSSKNMLVQFSHNDVISDNSSKYFNVPYNVSKFKYHDKTDKYKQELINKNNLRLLEKNPFMPENIEKVKVNDKEGVMNKEDGFIIYSKSDSSFDIPKTNTFLLLQPKDISIGIKEKVIMGLMADLISDELTETIYDASLVDLNASINSGEKSISLQINGFQEKSLYLLNLILDAINKPLFTKVDFSTSTFERIKQEEIENLESQKNKMPYQQAIRNLNHEILDDSSSVSDRLKEIKGITIYDIKDFHYKWLKELSVKGLVYGAFDNNFDKKIITSLKENLKNTTFIEGFLNNKVKNIAGIIKKDISVKHNDDSAILYYQLSNGYKERAMIGLLDKLISSVFFTELRTEKQLGYIVFSSPLPVYNTAGMMFVVESPNTSADNIIKEIEKFLLNFQNNLSLLSNEEFNKVKVILQKELEQNPKNVSEAANIYWRDILTTNSTESSAKSISKGLENINKEDMLLFFNRLIKDSPKVIIKTTSILK